VTLVLEDDWERLEHEVQDAEQECIPYVKQQGHALENQQLEGYITAAQQGSCQTGITTIERCPIGVVSRLLTEFAGLSFEQDWRI